MSRYTFMGLVGGPTSQGSFEQRPVWERRAFDASQELMDAADELARQQANGADIALLKRINPELADQLMPYAAEQVGYRGAHSNDPADHVLDVDGRYEQGEDEDMEDGEGRTAGLEGLEVDMMDELNGWALDEGYKDAHEWSREQPDQFAQCMRDVARSFGYRGQGR